MRQLLHIFLSCLLLTSCGTAAAVPQEVSSRQDRKIWSSCLMAESFLFLFVDLIIRDSPGKVRSKWIQKGQKE